MNTAQIYLMAENIVRHNWDILNFECVRTPSKRIYCFVDASDSEALSICRAIDDEYTDLFDFGDGTHQVAFPLRALFR